ncbi:hypothetical protein C496_13866 [Natronorubrum tibetense GA33]|uniref:Uncharacterized protein n=1 Tax=Natronorubrum tibetense GA33 TaxID=1114856 RepID=L9VRH6_9EURY|nr:hypothetical protein C496_13866 [Natronorubrum tibetense GA33]
MPRWYSLEPRRAYRPARRIDKPVRSAAELVRWIGGIGFGRSRAQLARLESPVSSLDTISRSNK